MPKIYKIKDKTDKFIINTKPVSTVHRILISGASGSGKTSFAANFLLNYEFPYRKLIEKQGSENVFIFSPTPKEGFKLNLIATELSVPEENIFNYIDDEIIEELYNSWIEEFKQALDEKRTPNFKWVIIDDFGSSGFMSKNKNNSITKLYANSRKFGVNLYVLVQRLSMATPSIRMNASAIVVYNTNLKELTLLESENNYMSSKEQFLSKIRSNLKSKHDFILINYSGDYKDLYLDKDFKRIEY